MKKPKIGRPPTGRNPTIMLTIPADLLARLDAWRAEQVDDEFELSEIKPQEAIRALLDKALRRAGF